MADVFISYAREDRAFVARLAPAIEALGLSVWWDDKLAPGREFELEIERELDAARAVVAVWSAASLRSVAVRAEAREALDQEKLAPVRIAPVKPPLFSRGIQFADLEGWDGDAAAVAFQDLAAQLFALVHGQAAASRVPRDGATRPSAETVLADDAPILNLPLLNRPIGPFKSAAGLLGFLLAAAGLAALFVNREDILGPYWEAVFVLALSAIALFSAAERQLAPNVKAMIARWLQPQPNARPLRSAEAFLAMFEAVFSKRHLTLRCFIASAVASVLVYAGLLLLWAPLEVLEEAARKLFDGEIESPDPNQWTTVGRSAVETNAALLFLAVPVANIVVDYFSLWQTRGILKLAAGRWPLGVCVALDAALTALVFVALLPLGPVALLLSIEAMGAGVTEGTLATADRIAEEMWRSLGVLVGPGWYGELASALAGEANLTTTSLLIAGVTTFTTSVWLWFALLFAPFVRLLSWGRRRGLSLLGLALNTRARPVAPLGYVAAALIFGAGASVSAVAGAIERGGVAPSAARAPGASFKECAACPVMVVIPGGSFTMGSPVTEPGRGDDEGPRPNVRVETFAIGRTEVTFRAWDACAAETAGRPGGCRPIPRIGTDTDGDQGWGRGLRPATTLSWDDTRAFIDWLNGKVAGAPYALPTEAQWEYAARAGATTAYAFGDDVDAGCAHMNGADLTLQRLMANVRAMRCDDHYLGSAPVGSYRPNAFGLFDMHGNVLEWVRDCYDASYAAPPSYGPAGAEEEPGCRTVVVRGGSWNDEPALLRLADRDGFVRDHRFVNFGFRVARALPGPDAPAAAD